MSAISDPFDIGIGDQPWMPQLLCPNHLASGDASTWQRAHCQVRERYIQFCYHMGRHWKHIRSGNERLGHFEYHAALFCIHSTSEQVLQEFNRFYALGYPAHQVRMSNRQFAADFNKRVPKGVQLKWHEIADSNWFKELCNERHEFVHREPFPRVMVSLTWDNEPRRPPLMSGWEHAFAKLYEAEMSKAWEIRWCMLRAAQTLIRDWLESLWNEMILSTLAIELDSTVM